LKRFKSPGSDQIPAELLQAGGEKRICSMNDKLINSIWNKEELPDQWKEFIILTVHVIKLTVVFIGGYHWYQLHTKLYQIFFSQG
jgi:hypothetical protein